MPRTDIRSGAVLDAVAAGHDGLYALADELGADAGDLRPVVEELVRIGWLDRRDEHGVTRLHVTESARGSALLSKVVDPQ
jgi:DNA-binding IclR family transcriptional regulator